MFVDMKVTIHMLTRTCTECGESCECPYVPAKRAGRGVDTYREAQRKVSLWWGQHPGNCKKANAA